MDNEMICEICGEDEYLFQTSDGRWLCSEHVQTEDYVWCEECDEYHPSDEMHKVSTGYSSNRWVCENCLEYYDKYFFCEDCQRWYCNDYTNEHYAIGRTVCESCFCDSYAECSVCGRVVCLDDAYESEEDEDLWVCSNCATKQKYVKSYSYKPRPVCKAKGKCGGHTFEYPTDCKEMLFGVELEIDKGSDKYGTAEELTNASDDIYIKSDGSLGESGMEIVTHPCTLEYHMEELGWDRLCQIALDNDYTSHDARSCGLHVHVGRHQLGNTDEERIETVSKIIILVDRHWEALKRFSRRKNSQINRWAEPPVLKLESGRYTEKLAMTRALKSSNASRYMAINTGNYATVEFRLFNGTLKTSTILATLQLVANICEYAKRYSVVSCLYSSWDEIEKIQPSRELELYCKQRGVGEMDRPDPVWLAMEPEFDDSDIAVGDEVFVEDCDAPELIGRYGRVIEIVDRGYAIDRYLVCFPAKYCNDQNNLGGRINEEVGYVFTEGEVRKTKAKEIF